MLWPYLSIFLFIVVLILITRLFSLKKELKNIGRQLRHYNEQRTNKKIDMALLDEDMEQLGVEINHLINRYVTENQKRVRSEMELKQAVANMSHDLRTPLTSILGYIQMANAPEISEQERIAYVEIVQKQAIRLQSLLRDFFELSVIESNEYQLKSERLNMKNVTVDVLMGFYDRFRDKGMEPVIDLPEQEVWLIADHSAVTRVIENLISNAIKYSSGKHVGVRLEEKGGAIRLIVQNKANTLSEEDAERLFDRFYMADKSRTNKSTGLGLSIVKSLMEKMNGKVTSALQDGQLSIVCEWERQDRFSNE